MELEAKDAGLVGLAAGRRGGLELGVREKEEVGEGGAKVGAIDVVVAGRAGGVHLLAARAIELDAVVLGGVAEAHGEQGSTAAGDTRAAAKLRALVLFVHHGEAARGEDETGVDEAIQVLGGRLDGVLLGSRDGVVNVLVEDDIEGKLVVLDLGAQAGEVEGIGDEGNLDGAEELVALEVAEPADPVAVAGLGGGVLRKREQRIGDV